MQICMHACMYLCENKSMYVIYVCMHVCLHGYMFMYVCMHLHLIPDQELNCIMTVHKGQEVAQHLQIVSTNPLRNSGHPEIEVILEA